MQVLILARYMDKLVVCQINGGRKVSGILRGFDPFLNLVLDEAHEETGERKSIGMVVRSLGHHFNPLQVIRGNSVIVMDAKETPRPQVAQ